MTLSPGSAQQGKHQMLARPSASRLQAMGNPLQFAALLGWWVLALTVATEVAAGDAQHAAMTPCWRHWARRHPGNTSMGDGMVGIKHSAPPRIRYGLSSCSRRDHQGRTAE